MRLYPKIDEEAIRERYRKRPSPWAWANDLTSDQRDAVRAHIQETLERAQQPSPAEVKMREAGAVLLKDLEDWNREVWPTLATADDVVGPDPLHYTEDTVPKLTKRLST